jgi:N-acetylmuramoyl-L-alanine amidase
MVQNHHREQSIEFASLVESSFKKGRRHSRGVQEASLIVLIKSGMPAVLVELGFISNSKEEKYLMSTRGKKAMANNLFRAFNKYKNKVEKKNNFVSNEEIKRKADKLRNISTSKKLHFGVQLASGSNKIKLASFKRFSKYGVVKELHNGGLYRYYISSNSNYNKVISLQKRIRNIQKDCFIIAINKGKRISVTSAKKLIK